MKRIHLWPQGRSRQRHGRLSLRMYKCVCMYVCVCVWKERECVFVCVEGGGGEYVIKKMRKVEDVEKQGHPSLAKEGSRCVRVPLFSFSMHMQTLYINK